MCLITLNPGSFLLIGVISVMLRHARRVGAAAFETVETRVVVSGLHPDPFRSTAYMDITQAPLFGLEGTANRIQVVPAPGSSQGDVQRALFAKPGVLAFNSSSISVDERAREHATMFAFGVPLATTIRLAVIEGLLMGVAATAVGVLAGLALTGWVVRGIVPDTFPDLGLVVSLSTGSLTAAILLGTAAVALAPVLTARRMRRMDIPSTLRVVE